MKVCQQYGIVAQGEQEHTANDDAEMTLALYKFFEKRRKDGDFHKMQNLGKTHE